MASNDAIRSPGLVKSIGVCSITDSVPFALSFEMNFLASLGDWGALTNWRCD